MSSPQPPVPAAASAERAGRWRFVRMLALDVALPLVLYYVLRGFGASQWTALIAGAAIPLLRIAVAAATRRRPEMVACSPSPCSRPGPRSVCSPLTRGC